jgi:hypothetical protein
MRLLLTNVASCSYLPFGNFGERDLHWVIESALINLSASSICIWSDHASKAPLGSVRVYGAFREQALLLQMNTGLSISA